jgi:hypothetical protein
MKEATGGISVVQIVILFILLFTGIMCLTINHSKAFAVKDEVINIIQNNEFSTAPNNLSSAAILEMVSHLEKTGHRITGTCPNDWIGYQRDGTKNNNDAVVCIRVHNVDKINGKIAEKACTNDKCKYSEEVRKMYYYDVKVFYRLDVPIIKQLLNNLSLDGSTKILYGSAS